MAAGQTDQVQTSAMDRPGMSILQWRGAIYRDARPTGKAEVESVRKRENA